MNSSEMNSLYRMKVNIMFKIRMAWVGRDCKDLQIPAPRCRQGCQILDQAPDQISQVPIHPGHERLQGWSIHSPSGQPVPAHHHPLSRKFPSDI